MHLIQKTFKINNKVSFREICNMKKKLATILTFGMFAVLLSGSAPAQTARKTVSSTGDLYVISAKAGGVNYTEGKVVVARADKTSGYLLKGDNLEIGDKVSTGADGKAEILLNPGSYVRLAENSTFEFSTTSLDDLKLKLTGGSAMFEVIADKEFKVAVNTPKAQFLIVTSGIYRVSVLGDGSGKIAVWRGKAQIGDSSAAEIKGGKAAVVNGNQVAVEKFDRDEKTALEEWSKTRAKDLARVNSRLQRNDIRNSLISGFGASRWNMYNSFGLWVFEPSFGSYCFLPFGYGWGSPYGYSYGRDLGYFRLPPVIYNQPPPPGGGTTAAKSRVRAVLNPTMPYEVIQSKMGRDTSDRNVGNPNFPGSQPSSGGTPVMVRPTAKRERGAIQP